MKHVKEIEVEREKKGSLTIPRKELDLLARRLMQEAFERILSLKLWTRERVKERIQERGTTLEKEVKRRCQKYRMRVKEALRKESSDNNLPFSSDDRFYIMHDQLTGEKNPLLSAVHDALNDIMS